MGERRWVGSELTPQGKRYFENHPQTSPENALADAAGRSEDIWTTESLEAIKGLLWVIFIAFVFFSISSCTLCVYTVEAMVKPASSLNVGTSGAYIDVKTLPANGTYTILVDPAAYLTGNMTLNLYDVVDVTGTITPGGPSQVVTIPTPGQAARLTFTGTSGQRVSLRVTGVTIGATTPVTILKSDGTTLATTNANISSGGWIDATTLPVTGTYTILIDPASSNTGSMTLALYNVTVGGAATAVTIATPGQNGQLTFSGTDGQQVTVRITENNMGAVTIKLLKSDGTVMTSSTAGTASFNLATQTLPVSGTYTIVIDPSQANSGSLNVSVTSP